MVSHLVLHNFIKGIVGIYIVFFKKIIVFYAELINLFKHLKLLTELIYLSLNKLTSNYWKKLS